MRSTQQSTDRCHASRATRRGFTLVELVVVLTIIGVMVAMAVPRFGRAVEQSRADFAAANLRAIWAAERLYWLENHAYTDKLTNESPKGLVDLGLLDPSIVSTTGDYTYSLTSADANTFQAVATRAGHTSWSGSFTISETGMIEGSVSAGGTAITPVFQ
jgi:prepilin-type N-terminal cleavage/methylation domain-containing protein